MADYIKREDVIDRLEKTFLLQAPTARAIVEAIPAADVVERKTGKWIDEALCSTSSYGVYHVNRCSVCRSAEPMLSRKNYCPNCGADMRGEE